MIRIVAIGIAVVLAAALEPQGSLTAAAAEGKARKPQAGKGTDISPWTVTHGGRSSLKGEDTKGLWQINVDPKSKKGLKAKSPKGKATEGGNNSYLHRLPGKGGKPGPKWSDIELKRGR